MFVPMEFASLAHDPSGAPVAILSEINGSRELRVAVSPNDASRIAILSFNMLKGVATDLSQQLILAFDAEIVSMKISPVEKRVVRCDLLLKANEKIVEVTPRPGEAIMLAIQHKCAISIDEKLFYAEQKAPALADRIREKDVVDFGTFHLS